MLSSGLPRTACSAFCAWFCVHACAAGRVEAIAFNMMTDLVATCGEDGRIVIMTLDTGRAVRGHGRSRHVI